MRPLPFLNHTHLPILPLLHLLRPTPLLVILLSPLHLLHVARHLLRNGAIGRRYGMKRIKHTTSSIIPMVQVYGKLHQAGHTRYHKYHKWFIRVYLHFIRISTSQVFLCSTPFHAHIPFHYMCSIIHSPRSIICVGTHLLIHCDSFP